MRPGPLRLPLSLALSLVAGAAQSALAAKLVPLEPTFTTAPAPAIRGRFQEAVARGAASAYEVVPPADARSRVETLHLAACKDAECFGKVASAFSADGVVAVQIDESGKRYGVQVHLYDSGGREVGKVVTEFCDICTVKEATDTVEKAVRAALARASFVAPAAARPAPTPATATESDEGPEATRSTRDAENRVVAAARARKIEKEPGSSENEAPPPATPPVERHDEAAAPAPRHDLVEAPEKEGPRLPYRALGGAALGLAGASLVATIVFSYYHLKYDDQPTCNLPDPRHACPEVYQGNGAPAAVFGVLTVLSAGTGALLLYLDSRGRHHAASAMVLPTTNGVAAAASFSF